MSVCVFVCVSVCGGGEGGVGVREGAEGNRNRDR